MARQTKRGGATVTEEVALSRNLGLFSVTMMGVGGMIGAGIFALTGIAAGAAGPAVIVVFILNGALTLLTAFAYAELGAAFPRAGGGYVWVKEGLGGANGFLAGWMSWFGYIVAGALYAIAFGGFAADAWTASGLPAFGLSLHQIRTGFTVLVVVAFAVLNLAGAEETGAMGAIITVIKIAILGIFVLVGAAAMFGAGDVESKFFADFLPNGMTGVVMGMGLTFIAFEGYEIIAQSGEEIIQPGRNVPRGIFLSILIAVVIYILVGIVAIGATTPPPGSTVYAYLGQEGELAVVSVARQIFPWNTGGALMLVSGLAATMSALNVVMFSGSRVSFAMGREHNLPHVFARIHPTRLTPFVAVLATAVLILAASILLPIETAAIAGSMMFLLMFIQVNLSLMALRHSHPDAGRRFRVPFYPLPALIAIVANSALVLYAMTFHPFSVWTAFGWIVIGLLAYYMHFEGREIREKPRDVVLEEAVGKHEYTVMVAVRDEREAHILGWFGAAVARARGGGLLATHMLELPRPLSLREGQRMIESGRGYFDTIREEAKARDVQTHSLIMIARRVSQAIQGIIAERGADFLVLGWRGKTKRGRLFGRTTDSLLASPPVDMAVVRPPARRRRTIRTILVPVDAGPNSRLAIELAVDLGPTVAGRAHARITLLHVVSTKAEAEDPHDALFDRLLHGIDYRQIERQVVQHTSATNAILEAAESHDLLIFGAGEQSVFEHIRPRGVSRRLLRDAKPATVMVKRRPHRVPSLLDRLIRQSLSEGAK